MMTTRPRGRPAAGDRRDAILAAALRCFVERGFHGTAIPVIAARARISPGTIYHYFANKDALVNALYRKWKGEVARRVFAAFPQVAPPREQFAVLWREMVAFAREQPTAFAFVEFHHHASYLDAESQSIDRELKQFGAMMVKRAQGEGLLKPVAPELLMELVFGAFNGVVRAHQEGRVELTDERFAAVEAACWDAVAVHG